jgi:U3 small nucleolar RNA-associated protein 10
MASTSLAEQLLKLSAPQSSIYKEDKKKASLLFDPKEAALKDRDTFYEIGLSGLNELIALYEGFRVYEDSLFNLSSKDFERAVQSKEVNKNLDQTIEKFLLQLSPYFLLQSSHKALEWLVNRYYIHQYNQNEVMALILPYHGSKIFVRFIQIMELKSNSNRWNWLSPIQKEGVPLGNQVWYNQCVSNSASLQFVAKMTLKYVKEFGERSSHLSTVFAFFCQSALGTLESSKRVTESTLNALLPTLIKAIESPIIDFRSSAYIILGFLFTKTTLKAVTLNEIIVKLITEFDITYDVAILITMVYNNQKHLKKMSEAILYNISLSTMNTLCNFLKQSVERKQNIQPFTLAYLSSVLPLIQSDVEEFQKFCRHPHILFDEVDFKNQQPESIIK